MTTTFRNVSTPSVIGYEWADKDGGRYQVGQYRGTSTMFLGIRCEDGYWFTTSIVAPERFASVLDAARSIAGVQDA